MCTCRLRDSPDEEIRYLTVVGLTRSPATLGAGLLNRATAYAPAETVRSITGRTNDNFILVRVGDQKRASQTASYLSRSRRARRMVVLRDHHVCTRSG